MDNCCLFYLFFWIESLHRSWPYQQTKITVTYQRICTREYKIQEVCTRCTRVGENIVTYQRNWVYKAKFCLARYLYLFVKQFIIVHDKNILYLCLTKVFKCIPITIAIYKVTLKWVNISVSTFLLQNAGSGIKKWYKMYIAYY